MNLPSLVFLAPSGVCALAWLGAGLAVPRAWLAGEILFDFLTRVASGSVLVALLLFVLGRAGAFDRAAIVALTVVLALAGSWGLYRDRAAVRAVRRPDRLGVMLLGAVGLALAIDLVAATAPPTSADALKYHLALPKLWLQSGHVPDVFWSWLSFSPSGIEMLYAQGLAVGGGSTAAALHAVLTVFCAAAVYGLARELAGNGLAGAVAVFLFVLQGIVTWEATSAFIELGLTFYLVLSVWHAVRWARVGRVAESGWAGALAGAAAGTKYLGLLGAAVVLAGLGAVAVARRRATHAFVAGVAALAAGGAWYVKNAIVTGNPVYPLYFGGKWVTPFAENAIRSIDDPYGLRGGVLRLPILPVDLLVHGGAFDRGQYVGTAIFLGAVAALFVARTGTVLVLLGGVVLYLVAWEVMAPQARFLLPALAVLAAVAGVASAPLIRTGGLRRTAVLVVLAVASVAWFASTAALTRQLLPVTVGAESRPAFLQRLTGTYDALRAARQRVPGTIALAGYPFTFNVPGRAVQIGVTEFAPTLARPVYVARLRSLGVQDVLVADLPGAAEMLGPLRGCLTQRANFHARFVTSRSRATSTPLDLRLYSLAGC